ncbi:MAG TPA: proprotein convertase P-domain-containing protein [Pyrinomonadaceae bacterium]
MLVLLTLTLLTYSLIQVASAQNIKSTTTGQGTKKNAIANPSLLQNAPGAASITGETEPNNAPATATPLGTTPVRVRADLYRAPFSAGVDVDVYSFFGTAGDRVYAATMTAFSGGSTDTVLEIIAPDGDILESDDDDGQISGSASNVAGTVLTDTGTHYVRVREFTTNSLTDTVRPYDLYVHVLSGAPTAETEPNNFDGTPPPALAPNGWMSGAITPAGDTDTYLLNANAGDTIVAILDVDPERDAPEWNAYLGIGLFNSFFLISDGSSVGGTSDDPSPSEAFFMTVQTTGTYQVFVEECRIAPCALTGAATNTYHLSVFVIPGAGGTCTTYTGGSTGAITDVGTTNFTLNIPDAKTIANLKLNLNATHPATDDLDVSLISPDGNEVVLFDDPPPFAIAPAPQINFTLDDEAGIPAANYVVHGGMIYTPEFYARLAYFAGMQAQGTWTLRVRDDLSANTGTVNSWGLTICENPPLPACPVTQTTLYTNDFETTDGGFTHSGTQDEWERGLPTAAPFTTAHSGTNAWKTDLDSTYNANSNQDLLSPPIDLTTSTGRTMINWWQKYQIESASFETAYVEVREMSNPANARRVWEWKGATPTRAVGNPAVTVQMSAGWGLMQANISDFNGKTVEVRFHLETDEFLEFGGLAVDDVSVTSCNAAPPSPLIISEFRLRGPNGANDEFVEIYNTGNTPYTVTPFDGSAGFAVVASDGATRFVVPNGTVIPGRGHYLGVNSVGYSLASYPSGTGDATYTTDIPDNAGIALFNSSNAGNFVLGNRLDAVGSTSEANAVYREGAGYPAITGSAAEQTFFRDLRNGTPKDTGNNAADFLYADTGGNIQAAGLNLGAPGPEGMTSPIQRNGLIKASNIDPMVASTVPPNRVRSAAGANPTNAAFGTLDIRRRFTNTSGVTVTRLRFRIVDITTFPRPNVSTADLRVLSSAQLTGVMLTGGGTITVEGTTLESPPAQALGGGYNSTLSAGTVTTSPIAPGASVNLRFLLGVQEQGTFRFLVNVEAMP